MVQVVYDIQKAQGTPEHTLDPARFDPSQMIENAGKALATEEDLMSRPQGGNGGGGGGGSRSKDYSPLVRALENYNDTVKGRSVSHPEQEDLWNSLVEWAGSQGFSHSDIDGYSKTIGVDIPNNYLREYQTRAQTAREAQFKAIETNAIQAYPDLDTDKAISLYTRDLADSMFIPQMAAMGQSMTGEDVKRFEAANSATVERDFSNAIRQIKMQRGPSFTSADLMSAVQDKGQQLIKLGFRPEYVNYLQDYMYNLWESSTTESDKRIIGVSKTLEAEESIAAHNKNMQKIANDMIMETEENGWLRSTMPIDFGTPEQPDIRMLTGARVSLMSDVNPDMATVIFTKGYKNPETVFQSLLTKGGLLTEDLTPTHDKIFMSKSYVDFVASSPNKQNRANGANTQMRSHNNWAVRSGPAYKADPRSKSSDLVRILNRNIALDPEDYQNSPDAMQFNRDFSKNWLNMYSAVLGNELNNSLPLFDDKGRLRLIKVEKDNPGILPIGSSDEYYAEDITEGYSMFGDRNVFTEEYAVGVPMFIDNLTKITGMSKKEAMDTYNYSVISNSDVGKRIAAGEDMRGRHISLESPWNRDQELSTQATEQILGDLLKGGRFKYTPTMNIEPATFSYSATQAFPFVGPSSSEELDKEVEMMKDFEIAKRLWGDDWYEKYKAQRASSTKTSELPNKDRNPELSEELYQQTITKRGIRNNNPGNIKKSTEDWEGASKEQPDKDYVNFKSPEYGVRAMTVVLGSYHQKGINTIEDIINTWAPKSDNNNVENYLKILKERKGLDRKDKIDAEDPEQVLDVVKGIIIAENTHVPYSDELLLRGIKKGIEYNRKKGKYKKKS